MKKYTWLISIFLLMSITNVYAFSLVPGFGNPFSHPVFSLGAGVSFTSNVGKSQNFPIQNPATDSFYNYSTQHTWQTVPVFDVFLGTEWSCPDSLRQIGVAYNQTSSLQSRGTLIQGADLPSSDVYRYQYKIISRQVLVTGKLLYVWQDLFHPYLLAALGVAFNQAYNFQTNVPSFLTFTRVYGNNTNTSFSYALGLGIDIDVHPHLRVGVGYRFVDLGEVKLGNATIDGTPQSGTLTQSNLYTNEVLAQLTWLLY